jgi:NADH dehydrogenase
MRNPVQATRILILGGSFGGVYTARHLQRIFKKDPAVEITLVDRDNYFLMTPLLFEAGSGVLEPRHAVTPIRSMLTKARFVEAEVESIDLDARVVRARHSPASREYALPYDHLVLALGGVPNRSLVPGSEHALTFKTLADAIFLRNHIIDLFEQAEVEADRARKQRLLSIIVIGAGLVGVELLGELTEFTRSLTRTYRHIEHSDLTFHLLEAGPNVMPEMERELADYAVETLKKRGVTVLVSTAAKRIDPGAVQLPDGSRLEAETILYTAGVAPNPLLATLPLPKDAKGKVMVDSTMRSKERPEVWAVGDCAHIPNPRDGKPYPPLAQHALREARVLAGNIAQVIRHVKKPHLEPFVYETLGMLASLGHYKGVGRVFNVKIKGFVAWWVWRTYYLMQMPKWDRRIRIMLDWTIALFFKPDVAKLDLFGAQHPVARQEAHDPAALNEPAREARVA